MSLAESPCYTLINAPDIEPYNEMQLKLDLGKNSHILNLNFTWKY